MAEKVKVSREVAEAIDFVTNVAAIQFKEVMGIMLEGGFSRPCNEKAFILNELPIKQVAAILINGYEIEQTPEEKLVERFRYCEQRWGWHQDDETEMRATANAIKETLDTLNIQIKGINK